MDTLWRIIFAVAFCWILNALVLKPIIKLLYYKKMGAHVFYYPIIGIMARYERDAKKYEDFYYSTKQLMKNKPDLKLVVTNYVSKTMLLFVDPAACKEILQNYHRYKKGPLFDVIKLPALNSIVAIEGEDWKARRRLSAKAFHFDHLKSLIPLIQKSASEAFEKWAVNGKDKEIDSLECFQTLIGGIFAVAFFGADVKNRTIDGKSVEIFYSQMMADYFLASVNPLATFFGSNAVKYGIMSQFRKLPAQNTKFREFAKALVQERRKAYEMRKMRNEELNLSDKNLLDIFFESQESQKELSDDVLLDDFAVFFSGGIDTSSHLLQSVLFLLNQNPQMKEALREEARRVIKDPSHVVTLDQVHPLTTGWPL